MSLLVHEVAKRAGVHADTVRRWERKGVITSKRDANGWRRYGRDAVAILRRAYLRQKEGPVENLLRNPPPTERAS